MENYTTNIDPLEHRGDGDLTLGESRIQLEKAAISLGGCGISGRCKIVLVRGRPVTCSQRLVAKGYRRKSQTGIIPLQGLGYNSTSTPCQREIFMFQHNFVNSLAYRASLMA